MTSRKLNTSCIIGRLCGGFPAQRPVVHSFDSFFVVSVDKRLYKQ